MRIKSNVYQKDYVIVMRVQAEVILCLKSLFVFGIWKG